ncbi:MAG: hypothetical protein AUF79_13260 [Crenarchaeota archaeon 13_1_20CM_2_51_8]|nr:MAG: hypothetical protein AUF79_13260 [Crenarchaeota archaeon 13_1_20CM_2_51_8]
MQWSRPPSLTKSATVLAFVTLMLIALLSLTATNGSSDRVPYDSLRVSSPFTPAPDFGINATSPSAVNVNQSAVSKISITTLNSFVCSVTISGNPSYGLTCGLIQPPEVRGSGIATVSCSATAAGEYILTLTGTNGSLTHQTTTIFNFDDFKIQASSPTGAVSASLSSTISVIALNEFTGEVTLTKTPEPGLICDSIAPNNIIGSGTATISCSATSIGIYILNVHGASNSLIHSVDASFDVANLPDFSIGATSPTTASAGHPATSTITVKGLNAFTSMVALTDVMSSNLTCQPITPANIMGSGTAIVSCNSNLAGTYALAVTGTSDSLSHSATATFNFVDFTIASGSAVTSNVGSYASSNVIIGSLNGFVGTVSLTDIAPIGLSCNAMSPNKVLSSGTATILCVATIAGTYLLTVTGKSGPLIHSVAATFKFTSTVSPDFTISATTPVSFSSGFAATSSVRVTAQNGFYSQVALTASVSPNTGLSVSLNPATFVYGSGTSTATFSSSSTPGSYTVTITGTYGSVIRTATVQVRVTAAGTGTPDFTIIPNASSLSFNSGASGTATIAVAPQNGFTGTITLAVTSPTGVSCSLSSRSIESSGTSTLTCNSNTAGDYTVTITATGGASPHTNTVSVHVAAVSPAPAPSTILGLAPAIFYGIIAGTIVVVIAGMVLVLRAKRSGP